MKHFFFLILILFPIFSHGQKLKQLQRGTATGQFPITSGPRHIQTYTDFTAAVQNIINTNGGTSVQSDWNETNTSDPAYILNKPTILTPLQSDWNETNNTSLSFIQNKPTIITPLQSDWNETNNTSLSFIQNKPSIPAAQVQADWNEINTSLPSYILNKPNITGSVAQVLSMPGDELLLSDGGGAVAKNILNYWQTNGSPVALKFDGISAELKYNSELFKPYYRVSDLDAVVVAGQKAGSYEFINYQNGLNTTASIDAVYQNAAHDINIDINAQEGDVILTAGDSIRVSGQGLSEGVLSVSPTGVLTSGDPEPDMMVIQIPGFLVPANSNTSTKMDLSTIDEQSGSGITYSTVTKDFTLEVPGVYYVSAEFNYKVNGDIGTDIVKCGIRPQPQPDMFLTIEDVNRQTSASLHRIFVTTTPNKTGYVSLSAVALPADFEIIEGRVSIVKL